MECNRLPCNKCNSESSVLSLQQLVLSIGCVRVKVIGKFVQCVSLCFVANAHAPSREPRVLFAELSASFLVQLRASSSMFFRGTSWRWGIRASLF